jgi:hypothetical protein
MRIFLSLFSILILLSCAQNKEVANTTPESFVVVDTTSVSEIKEEQEFGVDSIIVVNEMKVLRTDDLKEINIKEQIKVIEKHEKKTKLKVIDKSSNQSDTTSGWIAYSVPENMKVAKSYSVKVRISKKTNGQNKAILILGDDDAINNPLYESVATIDDIKVSGEMSAELRGDSDKFNIVALSTSTQNIDTSSYTEWEWVVVPKKSGDTPLKLVIKLKDLNKDIIVFNKTIKVKTNVSVAVEGFFEKYWQWLMTTIIIPIFIYFWNRKKKKEKRVR